MSLNSSENSWVKAGLITGFLLLVVGLWSYLAGGIFLMAFDHKFEDATPLTMYQYWYHMGAEAQVQKWLYIAGGISLATLLSPGLFFLSPNARSLFGDARFAKRSEIKKAGLFGELGIIIGKLGSQYLIFGGQQHVIMSAPTRSGKGVGIVIPNLLNWPDSVVVLDIKQENWDITSGFRRKNGQECFLFNPMAKDYRTHRYNPLHYINDDVNFRIDDIQKIGNMLFPDKPGTDPIWTATPRTLFLGVVLYLAETPGKLLTLGQVLRETLNDGDGSKYFAKTINNRAAANKPLSGACVRALNSYISIASEPTRAGVMISFRSRLELWMNPLVDAATSANDFDLRLIREKRMSIYLGVTPDNLDRVGPLLNLFFQQLLDLNTRELPSQNSKIKHQCLLLMDEFTAIGKIASLAKGISYIAGYWLRMMPIIQSPSQTIEVYGKDAAQTFTTNHAVNIIFPPKASETQTARDISEWLGYQTVKGKSESKSTVLFSKKAGSESLSDQRRALLLPQEITGLKPGTEIVVMENLAPILAQKILYFRDAVFIDRLKSVSDLLYALGDKIPTQEQLEAAIKSGELAAPAPAIDLHKHNVLVGAVDAAVTVAMPKMAGVEVVTVERPATADDVLKFAMYCLEDFAVDFSGAPKVKAGEIDVVALEAYSDDLCKRAAIHV